MSERQAKNVTAVVSDVAIVGSGPAGLSLAGILEQKGISYVVYEKYGRDTTPLGGCLDMHKGSGHTAFEQAGCYAEFRKYGRLGPATIHQVWDYAGNQPFAWGEGVDSPELDRFQIKKALLTVVPDEKIRWNTGVTEAKRGPDGMVVLHLTDGSMASGFKLVVGADGTWSKVRPLVTPALPQYSGIVYLTGRISKDNPSYPKVLKMAKQGPMIVMGRKQNIWNQMQGDGHYRCDLGSLRPADFGATSGGFDINNTEAVKQMMLTPEYFGNHSADIKDMIKSLEGPFRAWPLYFMPPSQLNWEPAQGVTLIGDAAHTTLPFVGEGANCAMRDAVILANLLKQLGVGQAAIAAYEKEMLPYCRDVIERSNISGGLFFDFDSPATFGNYVRSKPLIKNML